MIFPFCGKCITQNAPFEAFVILRFCSYCLKASQHRNQTESQAPDIADFKYGWLKIIPDISSSDHMQIHAVLISKKQRARDVGCLWVCFLCDTSLSSLVVCSTSLSSLVVCDTSSSLVVCDVTLSSLVVCDCWWWSVAWTDWLCDMPALTSGVVTSAVQQERRPHDHKDKVPVTVATSTQRIYIRKDFNSPSAAIPTFSPKVGWLWLMITISLWSVQKTETWHHTVSSVGEVKYQTPHVYSLHPVTTQIHSLTHTHRVCVQIKLHVHRICINQTLLTVCIESNPTHTFRKRL